MYTVGQGQGHGEEGGREDERDEGTQEEKVRMGRGGYRWGEGDIGGRGLEEERG